MLTMFTGVAGRSRELKGGKMEGSSGLLYSSYIFQSSKSNLSKFDGSRCNIWNILFKIINLPIEKPKLIILLWKIGWEDGRLEKWENSALYHA